MQEILDNHRERSRAYNQNKRKKKETATATIQRLEAELKQAKDKLEPLNAKYRGSQAKAARQEKEIAELKTYLNWCFQQPALQHQLKVYIKEWEMWPQVMKQFTDKVDSQVCEYMLKT